jgi:hypothetical protein
MRGRPRMLARGRMTHEETDETPVLCNSKDKYFLLKERQPQNGQLARVVTPRVGSGHDIGGEACAVGWRGTIERTV